MRVDAPATELLRHWARETPESLCIVVGEHRRTYAEFASDVAHVAAGLTRRDIGRGDRVGVVCPTSIETLTVLMAAWSVGAIAVPYNVYLKGDGLRAQLRDTGCRLLFADPQGLEVIATVQDALAGVEALIGLPDTASGTDDGELADASDCDWGRPFVPYSLFWDGDERPAFDPIPVGINDPALILYTSGTTGASKGCVIGHGYTMSWNRFTDSICDLRSTDVIFTSSPLFHIGGLTPTLAALSWGIPAVLESHFSASGFLPRLKQTGATVAIGVGWVSQTLLKRPAGPDDRDHHLRLLSTSVIGVEEQALLAERLGVKVVNQQYGQTECYPIAFNPCATQVVSTSCGKPAEDLEVALHDDDGVAVEDGSVGEIVVRPRRPGVMFSGYFNNPQATVASTTDLWFHTGDRGRWEGGELVYVDRKKDSIRRRGENISAFELERTMLRYPGIAEAAVHAVPPPGELEDAVKACLVLEPGANDDFSLEKFWDYLSRQLAYFAMPRYVDFLDALPRNSNGKVTKEVLRQQGVTETTIDVEAVGLSIARDKRRAVR